ECRTAGGRRVQGQTGQPPFAGEGARQAHDDAGRKRGEPEGEGGAREDVVCAWRQHRDQDARKTLACPRLRDNGRAATCRTPDLDGPSRTLYFFRGGFPRL